MAWLAALFTGIQGWLWAGGIAVFLAVGGLWVYRGYEVSDLQKKLATSQQNEAAAQAQAVALKKDQTINMEIDNALHKESASINDKYNAAIQLLEQQNNQLPAAKPSGGNNAKTHDNRLYYTDVRAAYAITNRQKIATDQANQLIQCQNFLLAERK